MSTVRPDGPKEPHVPDDVPPRNTDLTSKYFGWYITALLSVATMAGVVTMLALIRWDDWIYPAWVGIFVVGTVVAIGWPLLLHFKIKRAND
jgi:hypothetical protein